MKKVLCLTCGLVNLDKFSTYPYCAACGTRLPEKTVPKWRAFWTKPVRAPYWASVVGVGVAVLGVGAAGVVRDTRDTTPKLLVVYLQVPRAPGQNGLLAVRFTLDSSEGNPAQSFDDVRLRLARDLEEKFVLVELEPQPQFIEHTFAGQAFLWKNLSRGSELQLTLKPKRRGDLKLKATLSARGYEPFGVQRTVYVPFLRVDKEK